MNKYDERGYKLLAAAVVEQAAKDALGWTPTKKEPHTRECQINEVKNFFCSERSIFGLYMPKTDGRSLYKRIIDNYNMYGSYNSTKGKVSDGSKRD